MRINRNYKNKYLDFLNINKSNMESARQQLSLLLKRCQAESIDSHYLRTVDIFKKQNDSEIYKKCKKCVKLLLVLVLVGYLFNYYQRELQTRRCLLDLPRYMRYAFRPAENCNFCANVEKIEKISGLCSEEFGAKYAYSGVPVVVTDATKNWTALDKFDYWYFRDVYRQAQRSQKILDCQFLPYKTGFRDIYEALAMSEDRVNLQRGTEPWYFGWSNCNPETAEIFRRHYGRPYFLPAASENNAVDWFFIGTAGLGAHMHIDNVRLPSWQAQLRGSKRWLLAPPPECHFVCQKFEVVVQKGDIIVLDTNKWYHQTFVQPGELSLTIGAEYD